MTELDHYQHREVATQQPPAQRAGGFLVNWAQELSAAYALSESLVKTNFAPKDFKDPKEAAAAILKGSEIGFTPMQSLSAFYVIHGTPALYTRAMVALVLSRGHQIWTVSSTDESVTVSGQRFGSKNVETATWDIARAKQAKYFGNAKYSTNPQEMLYSKAAAEVARKIAPDVLMGIEYTVEDLEMGDTADAPVAAPVKVSRKRAATKPVKPEAVDLPPVEVKTTPVEPEVEETAGDEPPTDMNGPITDKTRKRLFALLNERGITDAEQQRAGMSNILGREIKSRSELTEYDGLTLNISLTAATS